MATFSHFWYAKATRDISFQVRLFAFGCDLLRIVFAPIFFVGLQLSAIYGVFYRMMAENYMLLLKDAFGRDVLAPKFFNLHQHYLFGGDINTPDSW